MQHHNSFAGFAIMATVLLCVVAILLGTNHNLHTENEYLHRKLAKKNRAPDMSDVLGSPAYIFDHWKNNVYREYPPRLN